MIIDPRQEWATPDDLFRVMDKEFKFQVDVCATAANKKCDLFISPQEDALNDLTEWIQPSFGILRAYCNPGFSDPRPWVEKAYTEASKSPSAIVCVLGLCAPSTKWFGFCYDHCADIELLSPRPQFVPADGIKKSSNPRENALYVFQGKRQVGEHAVITRRRWK